MIKAEILWAFAFSGLHSTGDECVGVCLFGVLIELVCPVFCGF